MADLLLEILSEEIPARMQAKAEADLKKALVDGLKAAGVSGAKAVSMSGPRRLAVAIEGLPAKSEDVREERKGPKVGAPERAVEGFLRGAGLTDIKDAEIRSDPKKGEYYVAIIDKPGRKTSDIIAELVPDIIGSFHWPKSMRWGSGSLRWVRPIQSLLCVLDGKTVPFEIEGIKSGHTTEGHRIMGRGPFKVSGLEDYVAQLGGPGHVRLTREDRRALIEKDARAVCKKAGLELVEDQGLLEEVTGLAEWPVVVMGEMDKAFLDLPPEVIRLSMRTHQKYFAVRERNGALAPKFITVANIEASDGGRVIAAGNAKVLSARLDDAKFFFANDTRTGLEAMGEKLSTIQFKEELGSIADKVERIASLARELAPKVGADPDLAERAARLCKNDLVSEMVYEFPELQGVMGRYYALEAAEDEKVANAIRDHYKPQGPSDEVPSDPVSIAVALADKLDTLVGFWAINEKPTGSKDPFALRRAALGVVRIVLENEVRLGFGDLDPDLLSFFADRLKQYLKDKGARHDLIDAVYALPPQGAASDGSSAGQAAPAEASAQPTDVSAGIDDLVLITKRVEALGAFLDSDDGVNLLAGYKRAANILRAEEKKNALPDNLRVDAGLIKKGPREEQALFKTLGEVKNALDIHLETENDAAAMGELAKLRGPVDAFFEAVMVNDEDAAIRASRLALLDDIRATVHKVADFSRIAG